MLEFDCLQVEIRWREIAQLLNKIAPPDPLTTRQLIFRGMVVFFGFFSATVLVGFYIKEAYFPYESVTYTSIDGEALEYRYIPEERVVVSEFTDVRAVSTSDNYDILRTEDTEGTVVELIAKEDVLELYQTHLAEDGRRALFQTVLIHDFHTMESFEEHAVVTTYDFIDASIVVTATGYTIAATVLEESVPRLLLASFDLEWQMIGEAVFLEWLAPSETGVGVMLVGKYAAEQAVEAVEGVEQGVEETETSQEELVGYYLLTTLVPGEGASVLDRTVPILRELDVNLQLVRAQELDAKQLTLDTHMGLHPLTNGGFYVFSNGKNPITNAGSGRGDELYLLSYDDQWELLRIVQLTINGTPHDFHPSRVLELEDQVFLIPYQQIQRLPQREGETTGYATDAGKVFVMALKGIEKVVGTIFAADYSVRPNDGEPLVGGRNAHMALWGDRLFVAHDFIVEEDEVDLGEGGDGAYRIIRAGWWKLQF